MINFLPNSEYGLQFLEQEKVAPDLELAQQHGLLGVHGARGLEEGGDIEFSTGGGIELSTGS